MAVDGVISVTLTGSYAETGDLSKASDIDTIVICDRLSKDVFLRCIDAVEKINREGTGLESLGLKINSTFGPIKLDDPDTMVVHLMVYDRAGHRRHVLQSPFTCLDWERSQVFCGQALADIYPVFVLQPSDFLNARRGLHDYLDDLGKGVVSYRRYEFADTGINEIRDSIALDARHCGEYAFHIMRYLLTNCRKMLRRENTRYAKVELLDTLFSVMGENATADAVLFSQLWDKKEQGTFRREDAQHVVPGVIAFVEAFEAGLLQYWKNAKRMTFVRHAPTALNDGSFLGRGRDPGILPFDSSGWAGLAFDHIYTSPMRRAIDTARQLAPGKAIETEILLQEIDYGMAEGFVHQTLRETYPEIIEGWSRGEDPRFPHGENTADVNARVCAFLERVSRNASDRCLVVTHQVVLRCLAGMLYGVPQPEWYKIQIPHVKAMDLLVRDGRVYPDFDRQVKARITDSLLNIESV